MASRQVSIMKGAAGASSWKALILSGRLSRVSQACRATRHKRCVDSSAEAKEQTASQNKYAVIMWPFNSTLRIMMEERAQPFMQAACATPARDFDIDFEKGPLADLLGLYRTICTTLYY